MKDERGGRWSADTAGTDERGMFLVANPSVLEYLTGVRKEKPQPSPSHAKPKRTSDKQPSRMTPEKYRTDPLFPRIETAVLAILKTKNFVAPVDVLVHAGVLRANQVEDWRFGRIPYLERVTQGNLTKLSRILRILGFLCHDLNLTPSITAYVRWGKGPRIPLQFTKTGETRLEMVYARHFIWPGKIPFHLPNGYKVHQKPPKNKVTSNNDQPAMIRQTPDDASTSQTDEEIPF